MATLQQLRNAIEQFKDPQKAKSSQWFFKTGKGEYGEGDMFVGITVPEQRKIATQFRNLPLSDVQKLLQSPIHEERLIALFILVWQFQKGNGEANSFSPRLRQGYDRQARLQRDKKKEIYEFYLSHTKWVNNWDLVDSSADKIVGGYLLMSRHSGKLSETKRIQNHNISKKRSWTNQDDVLIKLASSESTWERRIAIIATYQFIKNGEYRDTFKVAELLLSDKHDLIHKAVGWMLREVGEKVSIEKEEEFLKKHYKQMPRTMLRYAIEKFSEEKRKKYLRGEI